MPTTEHLEGQWREWRYAHVAKMFRPYGWTSLVAQYWLEKDDQGVTFDLLPGTWSVEDGRIMFTPPAEGPNLSVDGEYPTGPVEIIPGRNQTYGHGDSLPVYFGRNEVETLLRTTHDGQPLFGVRVRDPLEATRLEDAGVTAFDYDPEWRIRGVYTPSERTDYEAETVEEGVRESTPRMGTFTFEYKGKSHELVLIGKDTPDGVQPVAHVRDKTNGPVSYGAGRVIELQFTDETNSRIDWIDFNYAVALPCAFTNFVTCPLVPPENHLDFEVLAGEKRPAQNIARTMTYQPKD
ncbi:MULTISPECIES: DUF1684 domain-containing protein [unclassified Nitratireductor]|uniref:DUF1684 domain-containing protein n=1 Tax=unclassified Nitratireductor TaxID=2641084 RepID=UPI0024BE81EE|nr:MULTISPECIES: DUF1684 domain-containing protein [unclassified Nitratireductor]MCV0378856.1 DUF1684 domain-containing protein [Nitratireductor sp.]MDJ1465419.1 DUF1684 domain-containing protein [Nitratireductor sp. GZWM139]